MSVADRVAAANDRLYAVTGARMPPDVLVEAALAFLTARGEFLRRAVAEHLLGAPAAAPARKIDLRRAINRLERRYAQGVLARMRARLAAEHGGAVADSRWYAALEAIAVLPRETVMHTCRRLQHEGTLALAPDAVRGFVTSCWGATPAIFDAQWPTSSKRPKKAATCP